MHTVQAGHWALNFNSDFSGDAKLIEDQGDVWVQVVFPAELLAKLVARERELVVERVVERLRGLANDLEREGVG